MGIKTGDCRFVRQSPVFICSVTNEIRKSVLLLLLLCKRYFAFYHVCQNLCCIIHVGTFQIGNHFIIRTVKVIQMAVGKYLPVILHPRLCMPPAVPRCILR